MDKFKEEAMLLLGEGHFFSAIDPFNPENKVEGYIGIRPDHRYGALFITAINDIPTRQFILATPKLHYPFDRAGRYTFPSAQKIEAYTKLDGSNCFAFRYIRPDGYRFISYKTRLRPFLQDGGRWGNFLSWWKELLSENLDIPKLWDANSGVAGFSYEIFGGLNKHLIEYPFALKTALLFGITIDGKIMPPSKMNPLSVPTANLEQVITRDYVWNYEQTQQTLDSQLKVVDSGGYTGSEGQIWYLNDENGGWTMWKLKPPTIQGIHWSSGNIGKLTIRATVYNLLETSPTVSVAGVVELLKEEFTDEQIAKAGLAITKMVDEVQVELEFRSKVEDILNSILPPKIDALTLPRLPNLMRQLSTHFARNMMSRVFASTKFLIERKLGEKDFALYSSRVE